MKEMNTLHNEVVIGNQIWMAQNFSLTHFQNGDLIPECRSNEEWDLAGSEGRPAWCHYDNLSENGQKFGVLYNSFALQDQRGIVPDGWRIPTCADWEELIDFLGGNKIAGIKLKAQDVWRNKENGKSGTGSNEVNFNAYPSGQRNFIGQFSRLTLSGCWWSANDQADKTNWFYYLDYDTDEIGKGIADLEDGFSLRLIKI